MMSAHRPKVLEAVTLGQTAEVKKLVEAGHDVNEANDLGNCPIFEAVIRNDRAMVQLLLELNATVDVTDALGRTPIKFAESKKYTEISKLLNAAALEQKNQKNNATTCSI